MSAVKYMPAILSAVKYTCCPVCLLFCQLWCKPAVVSAPAVGGRVCRARRQDPVTSLVTRAPPSYSLLTRENNISYRIQMSVLLTLALLTSQISRTLSSIFFIFLDRSVKVAPETFIFKEEKFQIFDLHKVSHS
jgi:hypothetical protein